MFTMQEPFYGIMLSSMDRIPTTKIETLAVGVSGNVFRLYYNPDYVNRFDTNTIMQFIKHECLHTAFNHFKIWKDYGGNRSELDVWNYAFDYEVNSYLDRRQVDPKSNLLWAEDMGWEKCLGSIEYKKRLDAEMQGIQKRVASVYVIVPCNGGQGGSGNQNQQSQGQGNGSGAPKTLDEQIKEEIGKKFKTFDSHDNWPDDTQMSDDQISEMVDSLLDFAATECEKACGTIPGEIVGKIEQIRKKPKPVTDWKRHFRRYLGNEFTEIMRKSKKRASKRYPDAAGSRHQRKSNILVAIDTSGSVSMPEYHEFFGQIKTLTPHANFHVVECDTRICHEYDFVRKPNETLHGGGGTCFQEPVDLFIKNRRKYDALVYFTDGYCSIPKNTPKDTLWVVSSHGDKTREKYKVNGASVVFIPEHK